MSVLSKAVSSVSTSMFSVLIELISSEAARRSKRSARTPKIGPNSTAGANWVNATTPTQNSEPVSSQASQPRATR